MHQMVASTTGLWIATLESVLLGIESVPSSSDTCKWQLGEHGDVEVGTESGLGRVPGPGVHEWRKQSYL